MEISKNKRKKQETISHFCIVNNSQQKNVYRGKTERKCTKMLI